MLRLVGNDFKVNAVMLFTIFVVMNIIFLILVRPLGGGYGFVKAALAMSSVMILAVFLREEQSKGQVIYRSLPLTNKKIMLARFLCIGIVISANVLYGAAVQSIYGHYHPRIFQFGGQIIRIVSSQMEPGYALEHSFVARSLALVIILSIAIPLAVRYGSIWRILLAFPFLGFIWVKSIPLLLEFSLHTAFFLGLSRWIFFAVTLMGIMLAISWRVSAHLYARREV